MDPLACLFTTMGIFEIVCMRRGALPAIEPYQDETDEKCSVC